MPGLADLARGWTGLGEILRALLLTGAYPVVTYLPYVLVGMALGRLCDVHAKAVALRMALWGSAVAAVAYGSAWLATEVLGGRQRLLAAIAAHHPEAMTATDPVRAVLAQQYGAVPSTSWDWLLLASPTARPRWRPSATRASAPRSSAASCC